MKTPPLAPDAVIPAIEKFLEMHLVRGGILAGCKVLGGSGRTLVLFNSEGRHLVRAVVRNAASTVPFTVGPPVLVIETDSEACGTPTKRTFRKFNAAKIGTSLLVLAVQAKQWVSDHPPGSSRAIVEKPRLRLPTIHVNGTPRAALLEQLKAASVAVQHARQELLNARPHARDYYPQGDGALAEAEQQQLVRMVKLDSVLDDLKELYEGVHEGGAKR